MDPFGQVIASEADVWTSAAHGARVKPGIYGGNDPSCAIPSAGSREGNKRCSKQLAKVCALRREMPPLQVAAALPPEGRGSDYTGPSCAS